MRLFSKKLVLPLAALIGLAIAVLAIESGKQTTTATQPLAEPATAPFASYIGGTGQLEPPGKTIAIGASEGGIVIDVPINIGDRVKAGQILFRMDDRVRKAERDQRMAEVAMAKAEVSEAEVNLADYRVQLRLAEAIPDRRAISAEDLSKRRYAVKLYEAKLATARAQLASYQAQLENTQAELDRLTVKAPAEATVLQLNIRPGEYASAAALSTPLVMLGRTGKFHVRVQIDQNDAWRFHSGAAAKAYLRGNGDIGTDLRFVYAEPYVVTKTSLTGDSTERVDTRVLEVVYEIEDPRFPAYLGQLVDVFIEAPPLVTESKAAEAEAR